MLLNFFISKKKHNYNQSSNFDLVKSLVLEIFYNKTGGIVLTPDTKFKDIGFDSIRFINLMLRLEKFITIDLEVLATKTDIASIETLNDVSVLLDKYRKK